MRFFQTGNYMQMMNVLQPIAFDVLECLSQLFDYYLFGVGNSSSISILYLCYHHIQVYDFFVRDLVSNASPIQTVYELFL